MENWQIDYDKLEKFYYSLISEGKNVQIDLYTMIDFSEFRYDKTNYRKGEYESWLEDLFQATFAVDGFKLFERNLSLQSRIDILDMMMGFYSFRQEEEKWGYCASLRESYLEQQAKLEIS